MAKYLSRFMACSCCDEAAEYTVKNRDMRTIGYVCYDCMNKVSALIESNKWDEVEKMMEVN